jgi:hypothetical protein
MFVKALLKSRDRAPKARNMKARGKCRAKRGTSPLVPICREQIRPERPKYHRLLRAFSAGPDCVSLTRGDALRFASRLPLALIFRAVGAPFRFLCKASC